MGSIAGWLDSSEVAWDMTIVEELGRELEVRLE